MTSITATAAATQAAVTVATVRAWCRRGAIAAVKVAGRWVIEAASLARRIAIGVRRHNRKGNRMTLTAAHMLALGGERWTKHGVDRIYLNDWHRFIGLDVQFSTRTGALYTAALNGVHIERREADALLGVFRKIYFDLADNTLNFEENNGARGLWITLDGERTQLNVTELASKGIRRAAAELGPNPAPPAPRTPVPNPRAADTLDLDATYTYRLSSDAPQKTWKTHVATRALPDGGHRTTVRNVVPLFADVFDAIPDSGDRIHALNLFHGVGITIFDTPDTDWNDSPQAREDGRLRTTYRGEIPGITVADVLNVAARIRDQLATA